MLVLLTPILCISQNCINQYLVKVNAQNPDIGTCQTSLALEPSKSVTIFKRVDFYFFNVFFNEFKVDFDDGNGFVIVQNETIKTINYATYGTKHIIAKGISLGIELSCDFDFLIKSQPGNEGFVYTPPDMTIPLLIKNFTPPLPGYYSEEDHDGKVHDGCAIAYIRFANKSLQFDVPKSQGKEPFLCNPVIFVEGLDLNTSQLCDPDKNETIRFGSFGWDIFTLGTSETDPLTGTGAYDHMKLLPTELKKFKDNSQDVILLDFCDGADYIQLNSLLLQQLIDKVNEMKKGCASAGPNTIIGASMGGIISRHALATMEKNNQCHDTKFYVSFDSPHKGANISLGLQSAVWFAAETQKDNIDIQNLSKALHRPAPRELLISTLESEVANGHLEIKNWGDNELIVNSNQGAALRSQLDAELDNLGFPQTTTNLAIADGSEISTTQSYNPPSRFMKGVLKVVNTFHVGPIFQLGFSSVDGESWFSYYLSITACLSNHDVFHNGENSIFSGFSPQPLTYLHFCDKKVPKYYWAVDVMAKDGIYKLDHISGGNRKNDISLVKNTVTNVFNEYKKDMSDLHCDFDNIDDKPICFIPTMSALAINWELNNENLSKNIENENILIKKLTPFDAYYAPNDEHDLGKNYQHVELTQGMMDWLNSQLSISPKKFLDELPRVPNSMSYNYGYKRDILPSVEVKAGASLNINNCGPTGYGDEPDATQSHFIVSTSCNAVVNIYDGAQLNIGNLSCSHSGSLIVKEGSIVHIHQGGTLLLNGALSSLIIEQGAQLILDQGAIIQMRDDNHIDGECKIVLKGQLSWNGDIHYSGNGHFRFEPSHTLSILTDMKLTGTNKDIRFIHLAEGTILKTGEHYVELSNGKIFYDQNTSITNSMICSFNSLTLTSSHLAQNRRATAIEMRKFSSINMTDCSISKLKFGIDAEGIGNSESITVLNSDFNSENGIRAIKVNRVSVTNAQFNSINEDDRAIDCENNKLVILTSINASHFYLSPGTFEPRSAALRFINSGSVYMYSSHIENNNWGIHCPEFNSIGNKARSNIRITDSYIDNNEVGIEMYGGAPSVGATKWGLLDLICTSISYNNIGVIGRDIDLFIDNMIKSRYGIQNTFRTNTGSHSAPHPIFKIANVQRSPGTIMARKNYWGGVIPQAGIHYIISGAGFEPNPVSLNQFGACQGGGTHDGDGLIDEDNCEIAISQNEPNLIEAQFRNAYTLLTNGLYEPGNLAMASIATTPIDLTANFSGGCKEMMDYAENFGPRGEETGERTRQKEKVNADFQVFPNPSTGFITISHNERTLNIELRDQYNKIILNREIKRNETIDLSPYPAGIYYLTGFGTNVITKKLIYIK